MRRIPASLAAVGLIAFGLVGCSSATSADSCTREGGGEDITGLIEVSDTGAVAQTAPIYVDELSYGDIVEGDGEPITTGQQVASYDVSLFDGATGQSRGTTGARGAENAPAESLAGFVTAVPALQEALECARDGSQVVVAVPADDIPEEAATSLQLTEGSSAVFVFDFYRVYPARADGAPQFNDRPGMPSVVRDPDGRPGVVIPSSDPPAELAVETLLKGDGDEVAEGDSVIVNYTGLTWADKSVFDSSWTSSPTVLDLDSVVPGFRDALIGKTVGSQVLVVIPPDQGYSDQDQTGIPAGSTLVFVVDILGIDTSAPAVTTQ